MQNKPLVSIIVPAYKQEIFLRQCLESVLNQTLKDIEVIIVDEGDLDVTRQIIDEFESKDKRIKTIHEKNGGYGVSVNKGIALAGGEYIGIVEADDFIEKEMFDSLYKLAKKHDADIVKSDFSYYSTIKKHARKAGKIAKSLNNKVVNIKTNPEIVCIQPSIWTSIYKKDFLVEKNISFLPTKGGSYQDTSFAFKALSSADKIVFTTKSYLNYRIDNENSSVNQKSNPTAICEEFLELTRFLNNNPQIKEVVNEYKLINQYRAYVWNLCRISPELRKEFINRFYEEFSEFNKLNEFSGVFYKKVDKKEVEILLNDKLAYEKHIQTVAQNYEKKIKRRERFSVRINFSRIDIVLFGKQIFKCEF